MKITNQELFDSILSGDYNRNGFEVYRICRDEYGMMIKIVFIKDGVFQEKDLNHLLTGNAFIPKSEWISNYKSASPERDFKDVR